MTTNISDNILHAISRIDQKTVILLIYIAIFLIGMDLATTVIGLRLGLEEENVITLTYMDILGDFYGAIASMLGKSMIVIFPLMAYKLIDNRLDASMRNISLRKIYWVLYASLMILAIVTTLHTNINNLVLIMGKMNYG